MNDKLSWYEWDCLLFDNRINDWKLNPLMLNEAIHCDIEYYTNIVICLQM